MATDGAGSVKQAGNRALKLADGRYLAQADPQIRGTDPRATAEQFGQISFAYNDMTRQWEATLPLNFVLPSGTYQLIARDTQQDAAGRKLDSASIKKFTLNVAAPPVNATPIVGAFDTTVTFTKNSGPVVLDTNATVFDTDSANFNGGKLTVAISGNAYSTDLIAIKHVGNSFGQIGINGSTVNFGGVAIGTFTGTTTLVVALNANATPQAVETLLRNITFFSGSQSMSAAVRTVKVTLTDGDGGTSNLPTKTGESNCWQ